MKDNKETIKKNFSKFASYYEDYAVVQKIGVSWIIERLKLLKNSFIDAPFLEIGCGTGIITIPLVSIFNDRKIIVSDLSQEMLEICKQKTNSSGIDYSMVEWSCIDGEYLTEENVYSLVISGFTFQWFKDIYGSIKNIMNSLKQGGYLIFSFLGENSFKEWKKKCNQLNYSYTGNPLPSVNAIEKKLLADNFQVLSHKEELRIKYPSSKKFFQSLKRLGAGTSISKEALTLSQMKNLINFWNNENPDGCNVTYELCYMIIGKKEKPLL
ncbi:MAG: methyltransferase domain-containing protein [Desulfobacterales bacterium]|nr:methyltransferase domain-containing protein [Desulfobacterales bacterium]